MRTGSERRLERCTLDECLVDEDDLAFRRQIWQFLEAELPAAFKDGPGGGGEVDEHVDEALKFNRRLIEVGIMTYSWPKEYGGQAGPQHRQAIVNEALGYFRVPLPLSSGVEIHGPGLMVYGSDEQKRSILPKIADGSIVVNNGLTEPDAGSDLASLTTNARRDGDHFILNGQKTFQSRAHYATHSFLAVRTDKDAPKHKGISLFLVDLSLPGITIRPQWSIVDGRHNDVYFDDVRVPADCLMGIENQGWQQLRISLGFERSGVHVYGRSFSFFDELVEYCRAHDAVGRCPDAWGVLADLEVVHAQWRALCYRIVDLQANGVPLSYEASAATLMGKYVKPMLADAACMLVGPELFLAVADEGSSQSALTRRNFERLYRESRSDHARGTVEIQKNVIALRGLSLPR